MNQTQYDEIKLAAYNNELEKISSLSYIAGKTIGHTSNLIGNSVSTIKKTPGYLSDLLKQKVGRAKYNFMMGKNKAQSNITTSIDQVKENAKRYYPYPKFK
jgi:hypothetical protein